MSLQQIDTGPGFLGVAADAGRPDDMLRAHVMLRLARCDIVGAEQALAEIAGLTALHQISGDYDLVAVVEASHAEALDALIARIARLRGVDAVMTSRLRSSISHSRNRSFAA
ncbi:Lrp/AsnC ligand binding domain-containing protein [Caulobacter sp. RL271]|uniref:Lrp/AsnC ligand binding domain-containing protein n=1 Tax=Caulobacter segnis TaxID=88688 RepID=A0ABY4ZMS0_9CAUL|nr:Lrp/AsnC ligand binding domain-containing protein [Caulobacter segnis]USQ93960.1 Lrp/AsnC ligand binding domain-containing protein [Caulobacter segnis]